MDIPVFIESIFVGIYTIIVYLSILFFAKSMDNQIVPLLFVVGFSKHFIGYIIGIHDYYCNYGYACTKNRDSVVVQKTNPDNLIVESVIEGICFCVLGLLIRTFANIPSKIVLFGLIGIIMHITAEFVGLHHYFCGKCINYTP